VADRGIVGVSLKMYFGPARTRAWLAEVARAARQDDWAGTLDAFVIPDLLTVAEAVTLLAGSGVAAGAPDVFWEDSGPYTGEVSAAALAELGCRYVEVGHAERRRLFGEDDVVTARKAAAGVRHGLVPVVCVGELEPAAPERAAAEVAVQIRAVLEAIGRADVIFAYEPVWAIGRPAPAPAAHITGVAELVRPLLGPAGRLIYGGSAGRGLFAQLAPSVDGLFLGRFAHDVADLRAVAGEIQAATRRAPISPS
jgi:triosephosphate isomerase